MTEIKGLTGIIENVCTVESDGDGAGYCCGDGAGYCCGTGAGLNEADVDLKKMAGWAMNYLIRTPKPEYGYQHVFQVFPLNFPSVREGYDPIVDCDTDVRMDWEWHYMRDIVGGDMGGDGDGEGSGSQGSSDIDGSGIRGGDVEEKFHERVRSYVNDDGLAISHPGSSREDLPDAEYGDEDKVINVWGTIKILHSLCEEYKRTQNRERLAMAGRMFNGLKKLFVWGEDAGGRFCYAPYGMCPIYLDGSEFKNFWSVQPAPVVGALVRYHEITGDAEALEFAKAAARGIMDGRQPGAIQFCEDGSFGFIKDGEFNFGHTHATMHAVWGIAELGAQAGDEKLIGFAKRVFDWMLSRGTGTGWFPSMTDGGDETCALSDMISIAVILGGAGHPEYYDYAERYFRNYIAKLQFILTPEMKAYYRRIHSSRPEGEVERQLCLLERVQGAIIGGSGINDYENALLGGGGGFSIFGCCAPEGMRAIHTIWSNAAVWRGGALYINMPFSVENGHVKMTSLSPGRGGLIVRHKLPGACKTYIRVPHWADRQAVTLLRNGKAEAAQWEGAYICVEAAAGDVLTVTWPLICFEHTAQVWNVAAPGLKVKFMWKGNAVVDCDPPAAEGNIPLFSRVDFN